MVIRAWFEGGQVRARITHTRDIVSAKTVGTVAGSPEEVLRAVEEWLRIFAGPE